MRAAACLSLAAVLLAACSVGAVPSITGTVTKVRDADTVVVDGMPIRLNGIDAPENGTLAGRQATAAMKNLVSGQRLTCKLKGERTYGRWVGVCFTERGQDIAAVMIANGYALDCRRYSGGRYRALEPDGARTRLPQARYC